MPGGSTGSGLSVQDVRAHPDEVFRALASFEDYVSSIDTVRTVAISSRSGNNTKARIEVSRFKLKLNVNFTTHTPQRFIAWTLDRENPTPFIRECVGYWHVEDLTHVRPGWSRVWFVVRVRLRPYVPKIIEGLVARVGLRRATNWIQRLSDSHARTAAADERDGEASTLPSAGPRAPASADAAPKR
ncbi:hypothetical protein T492DRAFT_297184 [Pavlovales sp. CCMP2436]|nr:hypothetical protein T492DRAFT_297184 [Pavlovales sp. CCMP2436]